MKKCFSCCSLHTATSRLAFIHIVRIKWWKFQLLHFVFMISSMNDRYGWFKCDFFIIIICSTRKRVRFICLRHENEMRTSPWIWFNYSNLTSYRKVVCWMFEYWVFIMWISNRRYLPVANQFHRNFQHQHLSMKLMLHSKRNSSIRNQSKPIRIYIFITVKEPFYLFALIQLMNNSRALWMKRMLRSMKVFPPDTKDCFSST